MTTTTDLLRRSAELLRDGFVGESTYADYEERQTFAASLLALADQMERAEPVAWPNRMVNVPADDGSQDRVVGFRIPEGDPILGEYGLSEPLAWFRSVTVERTLYAHPAPEVTRDAEPAHVAEILAEVARATAKFPTWPTDPLHALAVLGEEFGELTQDVLQMVYEPHKTSAANVRTEALQTAAMALRFFASLDRYQFQKSAQHSKDTMQEPKP